MKEVKLKVAWDFGREYKDNLRELGMNVEVLDTDGIMSLGWLISNYISGNIKHIDSIESREKSDNLVKRFEKELDKANAEIEILWKVINKLIAKDIEW